MTWGDHKMDARQLRNSALLDVLNKLPLEPGASEREVKKTLVFNPKPILHLPDDDFTIEALQVSGRVAVERTSISTEQNTLYLATPDGKALAGAALIEVPEGLLGVAVADASAGFQLFTIPEALRNVRPHREVIQLNLPTG